MSGRTLLLHIGSNKTGSTSIQCALQIAYATLQRQGIAVLGFGELGTGLTSRSLFHIFNTGPIPRFDRTLNTTEESYRHHRLEQNQNLRNQLRMLPQQNVVVSDEYLFFLPPKQIKRLARALMQWGFTHIMVLAYLREPASLYLSFVQQRIKADHRIPDPESWVFRYQDRVEAWAQVFGSQLRLRVYDRTQLHNGSVVDDFAQIMNTSLGAGIKEPPVTLNPGCDRNVSLSVEGFHLLHTYRNVFHAKSPGLSTPDTAQLINAIAHCEATQKRKCHTLRPELRRQIQMAHLSHLTYLSQCHHISFPDVNMETLSREKNEHKVIARQGELCVPDLIEDFDAESFQQLQLACLHHLCQAIQSS